MAGDNPEHTGEWRKKTLEEVLAEVLLQGVEDAAVAQRLIPEVCLKNVVEAGLISLAHKLIQEMATDQARRARAAGEAGVFEQIIKESWGSDEDPGHNPLS